MALAALELSGDPVHDPVHGRGPCAPAILLRCVNGADDMDPQPPADTASEPTVLQTATAQAGPWGCELR
jgi:hypothetical protein